MPPKLYRRIVVNMELGKPIELLTLEVEEASISGAAIEVLGSNCVNPSRFLRNGKLGPTVRRDETRQSVRQASAERRPRKVAYL